MFSLKGFEINIDCITYLHWNSLSILYACIVPRPCMVVAMWLNNGDFVTLSSLKAWPYTRENHTKLSIWHENTNVRSNLREFNRNRLRWVNPTKMMDEKSQLAISTIWLVNRILATVII